MEKKSWTNNAGTTRFPQQKDQVGTLTSHHIKIYLKWIQDLHVRVKIIKLLEYICANHYAPGLVNGFSDMTPKEKATKE